MNGHDPGWIKGVTGLTVWGQRESSSFPYVAIEMSSLFQNLELGSDEVYSVQPILSWNSGSPCLERSIGGVLVQLLGFP